MRALEMRDRAAGHLARILASTAAIGMAAMGGSVAHAQDEPSATGGQDIIVTAQRRSERLQDVPMSITAITSETLEKAGIANTADLGRVTPGLNMTFFGNNLQPAVRGVTSTGGGVGDNPSVAIYVDGIYQAVQIAALFDLPDVQQIEVLKGPQGTLYGQNATGGAIVITTKDPSFTANGKFSASYGNYNDLQLRGYVSAPVTSGVAVSLAGSFQDRNGFRRHVVTGKRDDGLESKSVRGKILLEPADGARITLSGYYSKRSDTASYAGIALDDNSIGYLFAPNAPRVTSPRQYGTRPDVFNRVTTWGFNGRGEFDLDLGTLTSVTGYMRNKVVYLADLDGSPVNYVEAGAPKRAAKSFLQEFTFASRQLGSLTFLAGGLYLKSRDGFDPVTFILYDTVNPTVSPTPGTQALYLPTLTTVKKEIWAAYAEATLDVSDRLFLTAGGRYTHESQRGFRSDVWPATPATIEEYAGNPVTWSKFTPRITARFEVADNQNVYASWSRGFKGGLINTASIDQDAIDPETITSYEVGYKGRPLDNLSLNVSGFWYDYKNLQVVAFQGPGYITQNAASARGKGVDLDLNWAVSPEFTLTLGGEYLDAKYRRFPAAQAFVPTGTGNMPATVDLTGKRLLRAPKWSGNLSANYQTEIAAGRIGAFASLAYTDDFGLEVTNRIKQAEHVSIDAELSFAPSGLDGLRLVLWGKNLSNKDFLASAVPTPFGDLASYAEPRTFGIRGEFAF